MADGKVKVLVADDERWIRKGIVRMIDRERNSIGEVLEAETVAQALEVFQREMPDILLSDVMFPAENGCDLGDQVFKLNPKVKIVMISAYDQFDNARRALRFRAVDYLLKPVSKEQLNLILAQCVGQIQAEGEGTGTGQGAGTGQRTGMDGDGRVMADKLKALPAREASSAQAVERIMLDIQADCKKHYTLKEMADRCYVTEAYFSSLFKKVSGKSPMSYVAQVRVEKAQELIGATRYKLVDIAGAVGYEDYQYFTKVFKKVAGETPGEYRARIAREIGDGHEASG